MAGAEQSNDKEQAAAVDEALNAVKKKKRTTNPGVRVQGGRIYDSANGTTCHQCRQKTVEVKAKCTQCTLWWCPRCLLNRYGEEVALVSTKEEWPCPRCRGDCNCSNCRKRKGLEATGILANVCKTAGIDSVASLLQKNPKAKHVSLPQMPKPQKAKAAKISKADATASPTEESALLPDESLGERPSPLPSPESLKIHKPGKGSKRPRGLAWPDSWGQRIPFPNDCSPGDLMEIVEFLQVYGEPLKLGKVDLAYLAAELIQPESDTSSLSEDAQSPVALVHKTLLDLIRNDWGIKGSVGIPGWQSTMLAYLKQDVEDAEGKVKEAVGSAAPCVGTAELAGLSGLGEQEMGSIADAVDEAAQAQGPQYPDGKYWKLPPGCRLRMLKAVCYDALATSQIRDTMTSAMAGSAQDNKEKREAQAVVRKEQRENWQAERNKKIAEMIAGGVSWTLEEQREMMASLKPQTDAAGEEESGDKTVDHPALRLLPLGQDREGHVYWKLPCNAIFTGGRDLLIASPWKAVNDDHWVSYPDPNAVLKCLDERGANESKLKAQILRAFQGSSADAPTPQPQPASKGPKSKKHKAAAA